MNIQAQGPVFYYSESIALCLTVLRIRDPVLFWPLDPDPWSGMENPEPGSGIRDEHPDHPIFENLLSVFCVRFFFFDTDLDPRSSILSSLDLGSGMENIGSGINIPDPQNCCFRSLLFWFCYFLTFTYPPAGTGIFSNQLITSCLLCRPAAEMSRTTVGPTCHSQGNVSRFFRTSWLVFLHHR